MDTGTHRDDYTYYRGYEGEPDVIISLPNVSYHFWDGYWEDIFGDPIFEENGWTGFTRDYNELINMFDDECIECAIMPDEYLRDLKRYVGRSFTFKETADVLERLIQIMKEASEARECVFARVS